jgi:hypothetical protein
MRRHKFTTVLQTVSKGGRTYFYCRVCLVNKVGLAVRAKCGASPESRFGRVARRWLGKAAA